MTKIETIMIFCLIILFASVIQTSTGFGFSILATPFLVLLFEPRDAIQINLISSLIISIALIKTIRKDIDVVILKRLLMGSIAGLPVGMIIIMAINFTTLKVGISILILSLTMLLLFRFRIKRSKRRDFVVGGLSGMLTTSIGMPGPPMLLYFSGTETKKESVRATTTAFYLIVSPISLVGQVAIIGTSKAVWLSSGVAIPLVISGLLIGQFLFKKINQRMFRVITYGILFFTGVYLLVESFI